MVEARREVSQALEAIEVLEGQTEKTDAFARCPHVKAGRSGKYYSRIREFS